MNNKLNYHYISLLILLLVLFCISGIFSFSSLSIMIDNGTSVELEELQKKIFFEFSLPRKILALLVGFSLGIAGYVFQILSKNILGSPDIIGVNASAAVGAVIFTIIIVNSVPPLVGAILAALIAIFIILLVARNRQFNKKIIICGLAINALSSSLVLLIFSQISNSDDLTQIAPWIIGSLNNRGWGDVWIMSFILLPIFVLTLLYSKELKIMLLGDDKSISLGINIRMVFMINILAATILAATTVVVAGPISFLAFISPNIAYFLLRSKQVPIVFVGLIGSLILLLSDFFTELIKFYLQLTIIIPVGVITSIIGGIYLIIISTRMKY